jgi:hypothetical protein
MLAGFMASGGCGENHGPVDGSDTDVDPTDAHEALDEAPLEAADPLDEDAWSVDGCMQEPAGEGILVVGPGGFGSINEAVAAAAPGETIAIGGGTYREQVEIDRALTLLPVCDEPVWVDAECTRPNGVHVSASRVTVIGIGVKKSVEAGILIDGGASDVTIAGTIVQDFDCQDGEGQNLAGIAAWYAGSGIRLTANVITRRVELAGTLEGQGDGIWFKSNEENPSGGGHLIAGNVITGGYDGIGGEEEDVLHGSFDRNTVIEGNSVSNCWDDGIQVEGGDVDVTVRSNHVERCGTGIAFAPNLQGPLVIENNTLVDLRPGYYGNVTGFKIGDGGSGVAYLTGNTVRCEGDGIQQTNSGLTTIIARGNIFQVGLYVIEASDAFPSDTSFDEDCMGSTDPERFIKWNDVLYMSLEAFQAATGQELHGVQSETCD